MPRASEGTERAPSQLPARGPSQRRRNRPESLSPPATPQPPRVGSSSARSALARIAARLIYLGGLTRADLAQISSPPREGTERAPSQLLGRPTRNTRRSRADLVTATRGYRASVEQRRAGRAAPSSAEQRQPRAASVWIACPITAMADAPPASLCSLDCELEWSCRGELTKKRDPSSTRILDFYSSKCN